MEKCNCKPTQNNPAKYTYWYREEGKLGRYCVNCNEEYLFSWGEF